LVASTAVVRVWQFVRGNERLQLAHVQCGSEVRLLIECTGKPARTYTFETPERMERFQNDMESLLLATGWRFDKFTPESRRVLDRRLFPRLSRDRRRWWTDGCSGSQPYNLED
jgi:hypothetical protein